MILAKLKKWFGNLPIFSVKQRFSRINWWFVGFLAISLNLTTLANGSFPDYKLNGGLILMILMAAFMYDEHKKWH